MQTLFRVLLPGLALFFVLSVPTADAAIADYLVPCGNDIRYAVSGSNIEYYNECDICDLTKLGMNILNFLVMIMIAVAAILFANAGVLYITSPGNAGNIARAHKIFINTLVGILIILLAYLLIDTVMRYMLGGDQMNEGRIGDYGPWNEILCIGDKDYYTVKKLTSIKLDASDLVLPPTTLPTCSEIVSGASCAASCSGTTIANTSCAAGTVCCVPSSTTVPSELYKACTNTLDADGVGQCLPWSSCEDGGVIDTAACGSDYVCCPTVAATPSPDGTYDCKDYSSLQEEFGGAGPINGPGLDAMIACYKADPGVAAQLSAQTIYTYDLSHPTCNYTNGRPVCESCSHSVNSCHYGRGMGLGALGADFNAKTSESALYSAMQAAQSKCGGKLLFESNHTHVSADSCPSS